MNIAQPENSSAGLSVVNRDPRKQDYKPDAYVGVVEEIGPDCTLVKIGDQVVVERWEYSQFDIDEERLLVREIDILILQESEPAPGIVVMQIELDEIKTSLIVPDTYQPESYKHYFGKIVASADPDVEVGKFAWVVKMDSYQYRIGNHTLVFRSMPDTIVMQGVEIKQPVLEVVG